MLYKIERNIKKLYIILKKIMSSNITSNRNVAKVKAQKIMGYNINKQLMLLIAGVAITSSLLTVVFCSLLRSEQLFGAPVCTMFETSAKLKLASMTKLEQLNDDQLVNIAKFCLLNKRLQALYGNTESVIKLSETLKELLDSQDKSEAMKIIEQHKDSACNNTFTIQNPYCSVESPREIKSTRIAYTKSLRNCIFNPAIMRIISCTNKALDKALR